MELLRISDNVLYSPPDHEFDQPCLYAVAGARRTLMIDGGVSPALAQAFVEGVRRETGRGVDFVAVTHWHWDHVFGLAGVHAPVIACVNTAAHSRHLAGYNSWSDEALEARIRCGEEIQACAQHIRKTYPGASRDGIVIRQPDVVFDGTLAVDLGGLTCEFTPLPKVHTDDSVAIRVPEEGLLFLGDSTGQNSYDPPAHYSAPRVLELFTWIRSQGARLILESHAMPQTPEEFEANNRILEDAARAVLEGLSDRHSLMGCLRQSCGGSLPADAEELVEFFLNGIGR